MATTPDITGGLDCEESRIPQLKPIEESLQKFVHKAFDSAFTIDTMPDATLLAFADHGTLGEMMPADGGDAEATLAKFAQAGIDHHQLAADLQHEGAESFVKSWVELLATIGSRLKGSR